MENEIWKDIQGYEGYYQISDKGRIKSLDRVFDRSDGIEMRVYEKILCQSNDGEGYKIIGLCKHGKKKTLKVHKLVAMAFLNHIPCRQEIVCDHIDNDRSNNNANNLQLISNRLNTSKDKKGYTSKYVGVSWAKRHKKWAATIHVNGKKKHLGHFTNELDAHHAYQKELKTITAQQPLQISLP